MASSNKLSAQKIFVGRKWRLSHGLPGFAGACLPLLLGSFLASASLAHGQVNQDNQNTGGPQGGAMDNSSMSGNMGNNMSGSMGMNGMSGMGQQSGMGSSGNAIYTDNAGNMYSNRTLYTRRLKPQKPTVFQKLTATSLGEILPIYGSKVFLQPPSTFAPADFIPVTPDYVLGPGDQLLVRVWGQVSFNDQLTVDRTGSIYIPRVGSVHVAGLPYEAVEKKVRTEIGRVYRNFDLSVNMGQLRSIQVLVVGQAAQPGSYTISGLSTLINLLVIAGGPSPEGSMRSIEVHRGNQLVGTYDLYNLLLRGERTGDIRLVSGDVITIPPVGPMVAVGGSVRNPAIYELKGETTLGQVLELAGGRSNTASKSDVTLERILDRSERESMRVPTTEEGLATVMTDGDLVKVDQLPQRFAKSVTLRGNVATPGRFGWKSGMKLSDIMPDKESLVTAFYWQKRNELGLPSPPFRPLLNQNPCRRIPPQSQPSNLALTQNGQQNNSYGSSANTQSGTSSGIGMNNSMMMPQQPGGMGTTQQNGLQSSGSTMDSSQTLQQTPLMPYYDNDCDEYNQYGIGQNEALNEARKNASNPDYDPDAPDQMSGRTGTEAEASSGSLAGSSRNQANRIPGTPPPTQVKLLAPEIDWTYAVIERFDEKTLRNELIPFNPGLLVNQHDESQNFELHPGDVVTIFSQGDVRVPLRDQTKYVRVEGEVANAGVYSVKPGETLRDLVVRAGGLTPNAYLYGLEFTRESTRQLQQQRLEEYTMQLAAQLDRALVVSSFSSSRSMDVSSGQLLSNSQRNTVERLRRLRATGRIVLDLKPNSQGLESIPALPLENGDRLVVPQTPVVVNVVGAVYDQNSFLYNDDKRVADILHMAGGPNRNADLKHAFVIRADGSVISRKSTNSVWGNGFDSAKIFAGDTVVVPEKPPGPNGLRNFVDYSQIFSQLFLGIAAVTVLQ